MPTIKPMAAARSTDQWDAIVIGAGPAGAVAARQLALLKKRVLLVDKARLPRDKVCGGCLGGAAIDVLASIGLGHILQECGGIPLTTFTLANDGVVARIPIGHRVAVSRRTFDAALVRKASRAGVTVDDQTNATIQAPSDETARLVTLQHGSHETTVRAKVVLVATGLARCPAGYTTHVAARSRVGLGALLGHPPCDLELSSLNMACSSQGYVGIAAIEGGRFDVAAAVDPHALAAAASPGRLIEDILRQSGFTPTIDLQRIRWHGTPLLTRCTTPLASHRCLLIGDAAGYVEPFTGEGIGWAMHSALLAVSLLTGSLDKWDPSIASHWQKLHRRAFDGRQRSCRALTLMLRVKSLRKLMMWGLRQMPLLSRPVVSRLDRPFASPILQ